MTKTQIMSDSLFFSWFKNISGRALWVPFMGTWGGTVAPNEVFKVRGDPRYVDRYDNNTWHSNALAVQQMVEDGSLEFLSSPTPIFDNLVADGKSLTVTGSGGDLFITDSVTPVAEAAARVLPVIVPVVLYDATTEQFDLDWGDAADLIISDIFTVQVTGPKDLTDTIMTHKDRTAVYNAAAGPGEYTFTVSVKGEDDPIQEGTPVSVIAD